MRRDRKRCLVRAGRADKGKHDGELAEERSVQGGTQRGSHFEATGEMATGGELRPGTTTDCLAPHFHFGTMLDRQLTLARSLGRAPGTESFVQRHQNGPCAPAAWVSILEPLQLCLSVQPQRPRLPQGCAGLQAYRLFYFMQHYRLNKGSGSNKDQRSNRRQQQGERMRNSP